MLSVLIPTHDSAADLHRLLAVLVPAAVDGLVREVIAADAGSTDPTLEICEDAGVTVVAGGLVAASATAKSDWLLLLPVDIRLPGGWAERLGAHLAQVRRPARILGVREPGLFKLLQPNAVGLLASRDVVAGRVETRDVGALARSLGPGAAKL
ncbi:MAG TPA: glycosyltransferase [Phenylobacterium sp.]|nr:glycosyltransferase [Phenylobacterium sp.]